MSGSISTKALFNEGLNISESRTITYTDYMKYIEPYKALETAGMYVFSIDDAVKLFPADRKVLKQQIYYWKKLGWLKPLKKGLYELGYLRNGLSSDLFIANKHYEPSYVSLETALSYYSIIPEVAMGVTSITTKPTRKFRNKYGLFAYRRIVERPYTGYRIIDDRGQMVKIAEPGKALVDYIYFDIERDLESLTRTRHKCRVIFS
jgi:predicted transcriptional regulator of viral defense system